jgi:hypothetical protein
VRPTSSRAVLLIVAALLAAALGILQPSAAYACTGTVTVTPGTPTDRLPVDGPLPGTLLTVSGTGFAAGPVLIRWGSTDGERLGRAVADQKGTFTLQVTVPQDVGRTARVVATSAGATGGMPTSGWADLAPAAPAPATVPTADTAAGTEVAPAGTPFALVLVVVLAVVVMGGGVVVGMLVLRRRRTHASKTGPGLEHELEELLSGNDFTDASAPR